MAVAVAVVCVSPYACTDVAHGCPEDAVQMDPDWPLLHAIIFLGQVHMHITLLACSVKEVVCNTQQQGRFAVSLTPGLLAAERPLRLLLLLLLVLLLHSLPRPARQTLDRILHSWCTVAAISPPPPLPASAPTLQQLLLGLPAALAG